mmetsp:Transcript_46760/g.101643  ORF Transcript_46760/g.101643 Transcript_46760/m.101643 type:complete len:94 (-) Transcript_46760:100-381(-)
MLARVISRAGPARRAPVRLATRGFSDRRYDDPAIAKTVEDVERRNKIHGDPNAMGVPFWVMMVVAGGMWLEGNLHDSARQTQVFAPVLHKSIM